VACRASPSGSPAWTAGSAPIWSAFEAELSALPRGSRMVHKAAHHLLDLRGKHCGRSAFALASRFGDGFTEQARGLAVAVELVHSATLLHDDVVDVAERRRGRARGVRGVRQRGVDLRRRLAAGRRAAPDRRDRGRRRARPHARRDRRDDRRESVQLERRGNVAGAREDYFAIVEGKTAALFRWAMIAGARAARLSPPSRARAVRPAPGTAFQAVDDELDFADGGGTGKDAWADLREGKITYPVVVALERDPGLRRAARGPGSPSPSPARRARRDRRHRARDRRAGRDRTLAEDHVERALAVLEELPAGPARDALVTVALASLERTS